MQFRRMISPLVFVLLISGLAAAQSDSKQAGDKVSGKYEGVAKSEAIGELPLTVQIKHETGKLTGSIDTAQGSLPITSGTYADGKVNLKFDMGGNEGIVTAELKEGKIVGNWSLAGQTGTLEVKMVGPAGTTTVAAPPATPTPPASTPATGAPAGTVDPISGEWNATAETPAGSFPFTLKVKLMGDKITGESSSDQGTSPISKGTYTGGKVTIVLDTPNGAVTLSGTISEGKISGDFDYASQLQGKWEAKKKS